jgi:hypothetical protein
LMDITIHFSFRWGEVTIARLVAHKYVKQGLKSKKITRLLQGTLS